MHNPYAEHVSKFCFDRQNYLFSYSAAIISYPFNHLLGIVTDGIHQVMASGLAVKWENDMKPKQLSGPSTVHVKLNIRHLEGAFVLIGIGSALAIVAFVVEWIYYAHAKGKEEAMDKFRGIFRRDLEAVKGFLKREI